MATLAESLVSSSARPLAVRMRPDLKARRQHFQGQVAWVIKDPVGLNYFRLREEEFALLEMLDGQVSLDDLKSHYEARFPPQKITLEKIAHYVGSLHQSGLVLAHLPGQGPQLKKRRDQRRHRELLATLSNILAVRFRGIDPERLLARIYPWVSWFFTPLAMVCCLALGLLAVLLVAAQFPVFLARLPAFHEFFGAGNWIYLGLTLVVTKILHEFGHGLTCRHFGGECHEMGVMLLVLTPCLYCDVSDSWMLPSKWKRAAIGAAGMYVELVLASIATFAWWWSAPGLLNQICLSVMFVCSVSTVVFNANPLLRYDGYYILSDLIEIPNLRQKATAILGRKLGAWCLGLDEPEDRYLPVRHQAWFALYTVAAVIYRWVVVLAIIYFLYRVLEPYGLKAIGQLFGTAALVGMVAQPAWAMKKFFDSPGRMQQVKRPRLLATLGVAAAVLLLLFIPLPHRVYCPLEIQPRDAAEIYVEVPGVLRQVYVAAGSKVQAGDVLARLENLDALVDEAKLRGQCKEYRARFDSLRQQRLRHDNAAREADFQVAEAEEAWHSAEAQLEQRKRDLKRLTLVAPKAGTVLPPSPPASGNARVEGGLPTWSGTPLEKRNQGTWLVPPQEFCQIGDPRQLEANLLIDQDDIAFVHEGDSVLLRIDELGGITISGKIKKIADSPLHTTSQRMSAKRGGGLETHTDEAGQEHPASPTYEAQVVVDDPQGVLRLGLRGEARIQTSWQTLAARAWRYLTRTFNFKL